MHRSQNYEIWETLTLKHEICKKLKFCQFGKKFCIHFRPFLGSVDRALQQNPYFRQVHDKSNHIKCDYCDYSSFQPYMLKRHIEKQHNKSKQYKCNLCEKVFYAPGYLRAHQQRTHNKKKQFVCDKCDKAFEKKTQWAQHLFETHNIVYQYK